MHHKLVGMSNVTNRIKAVEELRDRFHEHIATAAQTDIVPSKIEYSGNSVSVSVFGHTATASPRTVRSTDGSFAIEYAFTVTTTEEPVLVWVLFLLHDGILSQATESDGRDKVCDFNNSYIAQHLVVHVAENLLQSKVFQPIAQVTPG